jgi:aryl-alcohol dehydrogenase-like predicted oxidoreductase
VPGDALIFGCATITHHETDRASLALLAQASDLGIVHFDTARAYGGGESEVVLGRHLRGRRDRSIVTTKYGLPAPISGASLQRTYERVSSVPWLGPVLGPLRRVRAALRPSLFSPAAIRTNLETSLRALGTDYVDYFLLHEATAAQAGRRAVTQAMCRLVAEGKVREFGIGSAFARVGPDDAAIPPSYRVLQFEHGPLASASLDAGARPDRLIFTHSALTEMRQISELIVRHPGLVRRYSAQLDLDLASPGVLPGALLAYSHAHNPGGKVIFSTRDRHHLVENVAAFAEVRRWTSDRVSGLRRFFDELAAEAPSG